MPDSTNTPMAFTVDRETSSARRFRVATLVAHLVAFLLAATIGLFADPGVAPSHVPATLLVA